VTSGSDVSTHPAHEMLGEPVEADVADQGEGPPDAEEAPP
jgi:hypothetical protein